MYTACTEKKSDYEYICQLNRSAHCNFVRDDNYSGRWWACNPPPSPAWANISIMMECTPESRPLPLCVYSVVNRVPSCQTNMPESTEYIFYCKRAILFLSSSKILTPHPPRPLSARRVCPPPVTKAGGTHSPGGEGDGGSIFWKTREIGLSSYSQICTLCLKVLLYLVR